MSGLTSTDPFNSLQADSNTNDPFASTESSVSFGLGDAFDEDPFKNLAGMSEPSEFTEDPFVELGQTESSIKSHESREGLEDPYAAFLDADPNNESSAFPAPSSGWLDSMERDACNLGSQNDIGSLVGALGSSDGLDTSSQTSDSLLNLDMIGENFSNSSTSTPVTSPGTLQSFSDFLVKSEIKQKESVTPPLSEKLSKEKESSLTASFQEIEPKVSVEENKDADKNVRIFFHPQPLPKLPHP